MSLTYCHDCGRSARADTLAALRGRRQIIHSATRQHLAQVLYTRRVQDGFVPVTGPVRDDCVRAKVQIEWSPQIAFVERWPTAKRGARRSAKEHDPVGFVPIENFVEVYPVDSSTIDGDHRAARLRLYEAIRICRDELTPWWLAWMLAPLPVAARVAARVPGVLYVRDFTPDGTPFPLAPVVTLACDVPGGKYVTKQRITRMELP